MKQSKPATPSKPVREALVMSPPSVESSLPTCAVCGEYLTNHWRGRACTEPVTEEVSPPPRPSTCCAGKGCLNCDGTGLLSEQPLAEVEYGTDGHTGPGWYYWDSEYLDEGSVGGFATRAEAERHATAAGYRFQAESSGADPTVQP